MEDKVAQRAVLLLLEPIYETDFRVRTASDRDNRPMMLRNGFIEQGLRWVVDVDISKYFTCIDHQWLRRMVAHRIADPIILQLISKWLEPGRDSARGPDICTCTLRSIFGLRRSSNHCVEARHIWCVLLMSSWGASSSRTMCRTSGASCRSGSRSSIWSWPRKRLGCYSLDALLPPCGTSTDRVRRHLKFSASSMSLGLTGAGSSP
ncbi:hypothetical protein JJE66_16195 [Bradyrhizobium diazoefficiens]|nr:hypothetical protein [Bradyrhizobium diazoefficiens]